MRNYENQHWSWETITVGTKLKISILLSFWTLESVSVFQNVMCNNSRDILWENIEMSGRKLDG